MILGSPAIISVVISTAQLAPYRLHDAAHASELDSTTFAALSSRLWSQKSLTTEHAEHVGMPPPVAD
eukprot:5623134-Pyramimonas_sp.AAC.1